MCFFGFGDSPAKVEIGELKSRDICEEIREKVSQKQSL